MANWKPLEDRTADDLREELEEIIDRYPHLTIYLVIGALEDVKHRLFELRDAPEEGGEEDGHGRV